MFVINTQSHEKFVINTQSHEKFVLHDSLLTLTTPNQHNRLKGTVSRGFRHFILSKNLSCAPYEQAKTVLRIFSFSRLRGHRVSLVNDYADALEIILLVEKNTDEKSTNKCNLIFSKIACPQFSNFAIEYLQENGKIRETVFACTYI